MNKSSENKNTNSIITAVTANATSRGRRREVGGGLRKK
jgi:hypothetical protein